MFLGSEMNNMSLQSSWLTHNIYDSFSENPAIDELCLLTNTFDFSLWLLYKFKNGSDLHDKNWVTTRIYSAISSLCWLVLWEIFSFFIWKLSRFPLEKIDWLKFSTGFSAQTAMFREKDPCICLHLCGRQSPSALWTVSDGLFNVTISSRRR